MKMNRCSLLAIVCIFLAGCAEKKREVNPTAEAPPPAEVVSSSGSDVVKVDHPDQFPLTTAATYSATDSLEVTGTVSPDVSRNIPVVSLASGRVIEIDAKIGDTVKKGQRLLRVQSSDISGAFADYRSAVASEALAKAQLDRANLLLDKGAIAKKDQEIAQDAFDHARITTQNTSEKIRVLGADINHPSIELDINAPAAGVITEQNVTAAAGVKTLDNSPNLFTISDLSHVWVVCDVFENDLHNVHMGEAADVRLNAYPDRVFTGKVSDIGPILDPNTRTAKVRLEIENPGNIMRIGMFVKAVFHGGTKQNHAMVPANAILHLHDRDWVYEPAANNSFKRVEVTGGTMLPNNMQEVISGIAPGDQVVANALVLQNTAEQ